MQLINLSNNEILAYEVETANTFWKRLRGLLGQKDLPNCRGLVITHCNSIHTFFMNFSIDVLFVNSDGQVLKILASLPPNRISPIVKKAAMVIELTAGRAAATKTRPGDYINLQQRGE